MSETIIQDYPLSFFEFFESTNITIQKNSLPFLENIIWLICRYHDAGKFSVLWQEYSVLLPGKSGLF
jgi:hypothetical protein